MLIGFIGSPCSGKTTTAALTFAELKELGISSEFIPEQARLHIASLRFNAQGKDIQLQEVDQFEILKAQAKAEETFNKYAPASQVVITDSCLLNTLLYLSPESVNDFAIQEGMAAGLKRYDLLFYCGPVKPPQGVDPNRVHNQEQSQALDLKIPSLIQFYGLEVTYLFGESRERHRQVIQKILERMSS